MKKVSKVKQIAGVQALGTQVLLEVLTPQEALGTILHVGDTQKDTPQGYVLSVGHMVPKEWGLKKGDRVFFSANTAVCPPGQAGDGRRQFCIDYSSIKGILVEA